MRRRPLADIQQSRPKHSSQLQSLRTLKSKLEQGRQGQNKDVNIQCSPYHSLDDDHVDSDRIHDGSKNDGSAHRHSRPICNSCDCEAYVDCEAHRSGSPEELVVEQEDGRFRKEGRDAVKTDEHGRDLEVRPVGHPA